MTSELQSNQHLKVLAGNPTPEELAVVVAVIQAAASSAVTVPAKPQPVSRWHRNPGILRGTLSPGHGQWGASARRGLN